MATYELFLGEESFLPEGTQAKHGDLPLSMTFARPADALWTESNWFCFDILVKQFSDAKVNVRFLAKDGRSVDIHYELLPNVRVPFRVRLAELWNKRHFLPVFPGSYKSGLSGATIDPQDVASIVIEVTPRKEFVDARLYRVYISDCPPSGVRAEKPMIDSLGQLIDRDWPTKTHSFEEMDARLRAEYAHTQVPLENALGRSRWGGFLQKRFDATGWFRTQYDGQRWFLVDPDGYAFFSHGMCYGTRMGEFGWYSGLESFYEDAPSPRDPAFRDAFTHPGLIAEFVKRHGVTERSDEWMYNPARGNMIRVFGENWWEAWRAIAARRFREWGINTTGVGIVNFIDERLEDFLRLSQLPYAVTLKRFPVTEHFIFRDFPDVFSAEYQKNSEIFAANELRPMANDPCLLGYFLHNEPEWMFQADTNVAWELLVRNEPYESRRHMAAWLKARYGDISALNRAWGVSLDDFEAFLKPLPRSTALSEQGWRDLKEYEGILIMAFGEIPFRACRKVDPHHLCLGLRHGGFSEKVVEGSRIFDVFSFNCYHQTPAERLEMTRRLNMPVIIGEWHFGGPDSGLLRTALISGATQTERAKAYRRYLEYAAACPWCVGAHYFEYNNQTLMGRFDGEHMAHGIIDCTNLPYPEMVRAISECSHRLYDVATGKLAPFDEPVKYLDPMW